MGFDLSGLNPNLTRPQPPLPPFPERTDKDWEKYNDWQEENSGVYFRNNVWWWRPLWNFVTITPFSVSPPRPSFLNLVS